MYSILFYWVIIERIKLTFPKETLISIMASGSVDVYHFCTVITSWLIYAFRQKQVQKIFYLIEKSDLNGQLLGIADNCEKILTTLNIRTVFVVCFFFVLITMEQALRIRIALGNPFIWLLFKMVHIVIHIIVLIFVTNLELVRLKYYRINIWLRHLPALNYRRELIIQEPFELR